ncbi:thiopeptide-type bacteriocin biosynthesis protein [Streptomyces bohaiensis]|uniref:thiopeptide-type bacteriocin biosynthesis protein n=1 Tax=Streptomyces bohaiensis TaxID=1431344 RepID=UPI003B7D5835
MNHPPPEPATAQPATPAAPDMPAPAAPAGAAVPGDGDTAWRAWHLHLGTLAVAAHDRVVTEVVAAAVAAVPGHPWFFLRYWHGGPHVRLRIAGLDQQGADRVEAVLAEKLPAAGSPRDGEEPIAPEEYRRNAARMTAAGDEPTHAEVEELLAPGVHRFAYHPEYERYGGAALLPESERLFHLSSGLCLAFLRRAPSPGARAALALRAAHAAGRALGDAEEEAAFAHLGLQAWRGWATGFGYGPQQVDQVCRSAGPVPVPADPGPLAPWRDALAALAERVRAETDLHPGQVLSSHVHMLHNRLGLRVIEELQTYARLTHLVEGPAPSSFDPDHPSQGATRPDLQERQ